MAQTVFSIRQACLPLLSSASEVFPIHRIYCIVRNYREHAIEMGHDPEREPPFFFQKPADAATTSRIIPFPPKTTNLHYEAELVIALGKKGRNIDTVEKAQDLIFGYSVGCDLTRRDLQAEAKRLSRPWCIAKGFDHSAPMTPIVRKEEISTNFISSDTKIRLWVNQELKQNSPLSEMIWDIPEMIQYLSRYYTLQPGDLIMTGTPAGVGKIQVGDKVRISCGANLPECHFAMVEPSEEL
mmetsp:Transcript_8049/g.12606  ORF Transcript_8049/g.12606 Transcript_8049/m.12606 type:complete len:240 (+) Transcript_8049:75-794(+)